MARSIDLENVLELFTASHDVTRGETLCGREIEARAEMRALNSKYVLSKKMVLWQANAYEQCLFVTADTLTEAMANDWWTFLTQTAEEPLVHPGEKYPPEGHMYTYLTVVFIADRVEEAAAKAVERFRFTKNYLFSLRGWATGRAMTMEKSTGRITANRAAADMKKHFRKWFNQA